MPEPMPEDQYDGLYDVRPLNPEERLTVCRRCGSVVADRSDHDQHHDALDRRIDNTE